MKQLVYAEPVNNEELRLRIEDAPQKKKKNNRGCECVDNGGRDFEQNNY
jgi:hypothetical protein